ncbi:CPBP family intramembrane glutamic endopeptidase [Amycolatopsis sp. FDAARGOS 1241]|uniref:CPBP family intramembrane glutamic endopeptidase n=1 Tax=Amycolatopsis sp. FDAARGOS 1241 TaxID=2778070 RepID=UPI00351C680D
MTTTEPRTSTRLLLVVVCVAVLATATTLANRVLPGWAYPVCGAVTVAVLLTLAFGAGYTSADLGVSRATLGRAARTGLLGAAFFLLLFGIAAAVPTLRTVYHDGRVGTPDLPQLAWLTLGRITFGTVVVEEIAFRSVLPALLGARDDRWRWGPILGASAFFGLWHFLPAPAVGRNAAVHAALGGIPAPVLQVLAMVAATAAGVFLHAWRHFGRGVLASVLVHFTTNVGGLVVAVAVQS